MKPIARGIFELARSLAAQTPGFEERRGPGRNAGDGLTRDYLKKLDEIVGARWPSAVDAQRPIGTNAGYTFDYYIRSEQTAVEIALSLRNPLSEFERDVFKAMLAKENGLALRNLILLGKRGAVKRLSAPGPSAIIAWAARHCGIDIEVKDLT